MLKEKIANLKSKLKSKSNSKKGMNCIETTIIVVIVMLCIMTMLDLMETTQEMSASTTAVNYITRLLGRQGGISNTVPDNFESYGHGSYITTQAAYEIINTSLRKAYSIPADSDYSVLGKDVKVYLSAVSLKNGAVINKQVTELTPDTHFGVYINHMSGGTGSTILISQESMLYHETYYIITLDMHYDMYTLQRLLNAYDHQYYTENEGWWYYKKTFSRFIIPTYYNREYDIGNYKPSSQEWFVK